MKKVAIFFMIFILLYIPYIILKASFIGMGDIDAGESDGILYIFIDFIFCFLLFGNIVKYHISLPSQVILSLLFCIFQFLIILTEDGDLRMTMRLLSWVFVLSGGFVFLKYNGQYMGYVVELMILGYLFLSIYTCYSVVDVRGALMITGMNEVYWILPSISFAFMTKKRWLSKSLIIVVGVAVLLSLKSGAVVAYVLALIFAYFVNSKNKGNKVVGKQIFILFLFVLTVYLAWSTMSTYLEDELSISWGDKAEDLTDSQGSGRGIIWTKVFGLLANSNFTDFLIGHGHNSVVNATKDFSAHNDFLEILYDYGLFMFILYIIILFNMFKRLIMLIKENHTIAIPFGVSLVVFVVISMVSHLIIYPGLMLSFAIIWAICWSAPKKKIELC